MASQVFGGATNATNNGKQQHDGCQPGQQQPICVESDLLGTLAGLDACEPDAGGKCRPFAAKIANDHARIDAASHAAATAPRVSMDPALNISVVAATQMPHKVAETMKLVRQACPRRSRAIQHPEKARNGRITELLLISSIVDLGF
jgi:hypothetical protein